jgi:hypothetical protein
MPGGGGDTTVTQKNAMTDIQANFAKQIGPEIMKYVMSGLTGSPTGSQVRGAGMASEMLRKNAGMMGISPGSPQLLDQFRKIAEGLTKPNPDIMSTALALYTGVPGGSMTQSGGGGGALTDIGSLMGTGVNAALMYKLLGPMLSGGAGAAGAVGGTVLPDILGASDISAFAPFLAAL